MNKKLVSAAVLLGLSGAATAVNVNPDGLGSVLLYPYYTVNNGKFTNIQVVNTTNKTKAVKVRVNEGVNTWEVLDFNLYLSPWDAWTAAISIKDGVPSLRTEDTSCALGVTVGAYVPLNPDLIDLYSESHKDPGSLTSAQRLTEGHIEIIEMGEVTNEKMIKAIDHGTTGVATDCSAVANAWKGSLWSRTNPNVDIDAPAGGLFGSASIYDVTNGSAASYNATAVENFYTVPAHAYPQSSFPNVAGQLQQGNSIVNAANNVSNVINGADNTIVTTTWNNPADALSAVLMAESIYNEYYIADSAKAATDWVITFPTKHSYVNADTSKQGSGAAYTSGQFGQLLAGQTGRDTGVAPFAGGFSVPVAIGYYDREEQFKQADIGFLSPIVGDDPQSISYEVNVVEVSGARNVLGSNLSNAIVAPYDAGWGVLNFSNSSLEAPAALNNGETHTYYGRPVLGFALTEVQNESVNGTSTLANYATLYNHKYKRNISVSN